MHAVIIRVADRHLSYAREVEEKLAGRGLRVEVDDSLNSMQKKIRENAGQKIPYLLIVGDVEAESDTVNVRTRGKKKQEAMKTGEFVDRALAEFAARDSYGQR